jgi:hypothetical protein
VIDAIINVISIACLGLQCLISSDAGIDTIVEGGIVQRNGALILATSGVGCMP